MGSLRRQVITGFVFLLSIGIVASCSSSDDEGEDSKGESPCRAFARNQTELLTTELVRKVSSGVVVRIVSSPRGAFALTDTKELYPLDDAEADPIKLRPLAGREVIDVTVANEDRVYAAVRTQTGGVDVLFLRNLASPQPVTSTVFSLANVPPQAKIVLAVDRAGNLLIGTPDVSPSQAQDPASMNGKLLRISAPEQTPALVDVFARGFRAPSFLSVDLDRDEVWMTDVITSSVGSLHYEVNRVAFGKSYGWPTIDGLRCADGSTTCVRDGQVPPLYAPLTDPLAVFYRGVDWPLSGHLLTKGGGSIGTIAPLGPSGTPLVSPIAHPIDQPFEQIGVGRGGVYVVVGGSEVHVIANAQPRPVPTTLSATGCIPNEDGEGPPGAIAYDVASPLWSDGAEKKRFVVLPKGTQARVLEDGDIRFPVGTVAMKTFFVDGRRIETRLLIQHSLEFWVGYSYRWSAEGQDASLVIGNRTEQLPNGKKWYFPSSTECSACHTPAAGYTLGLESRQIAAGNSALESKLVTPIDHAKFPSFSSTDPGEKRARAYLHANCSVCHREGSVTGIAELDLRFDTALDKTGLCNPPKVDSLGVAADARVVTPKKPEDSILVKRMRSLDPDVRMPKLATHVVDEAGVAIVEDWIRNLASCP